MGDADITTLPALNAEAAREELYSAQRLHALATDFRRAGDGAAAALFDALSLEAEQRYRLLAGDAALSAPAGDDPVSDSDPLPVTAYRALAETVRRTERAFTRYSSLAAQAGTAALRDRAEALAAAKLGEAARLRHARRAAYHLEMPGLPWPPPAEITTRTALLAVAPRAEADLLARYEHPATTAAGRAFATATRPILSHLVGLGAAPPPRHAIPPPRPGSALRDAAEAFRFYDAVVARAADEETLALAQHLAGLAVSRLKAVSTAARHSAAAVRPKG